MASSPATNSTSRRRVSYVIPPPSDTVPRLLLPPDGTPKNGQTGPLLRIDPSQDRLSSASSQLSGSVASFSNSHGHPKHRLGITSFALDASTFLEGRQTPSGILYSGGRDGMLMAWDLSLPMRLRSSPSSVSLSTSGTSRRLGKWERLTSEEEDLIEEEEEEEEWPMSDGDILGDVIPSGGLRGALSRMKNSSELPYEKRWELDAGQLRPGQPAYWRQHTQAHTDWVNDILLCNLNQTVISGSSDGTVKAWSPHSPHDKGASTIGTHSDYVRCLSQCSERKWILSGSFDRTIKIWDASEARPSAVTTLFPPDSSSAKASVYAVAADPMGHVIAAGGPERIIRTWDPRSGKRIGKLVGHTDNIRAILISEDSRYLLSGSADASIKLWSLLSPQTCIHTFTHHTESVWSLYSSHPNLETFYSGDRSGLVCRVDVEQCSKIGEGECAVLLQDNVDGGLSSSDGVSKILAMDDHLVWTASGSSSIRRWRVPQSRAMRRSPAGKLSHSIPMPSPKVIQPALTSHASNPSLSLDNSTRRRLRGESMTPSITASIFSDDVSFSDDTTEAETSPDGIPYDCLVHLASPGAGPSLLSTVSVVKLTHRQSLSAGQATLGSSNTGSRRDTLGLPVPDGLPLQAPQSAKVAYEERDVAPDAVPLISEPDFISEGAHGLVRALTLNDRVHALTVDTAGTVAVWDVVRSRCLGTFPREVVHCASGASRGTSVATGAVGDGQEDQAKKLSPRQALEIVRERIEGEAVVNAWSNVDTKIGELTVHIGERCFDSEVFADEVGFKNPEKNTSDDQRINVGKWILRNLFINFIHEEQRAVTRVSHDSHKAHHRYHSGGHHRSKSDHVTSNRHGHSSTPLIPAIPPAVSNFKLQHLSPIAQSPDSVSGDGQSTPKPIQATLPSFGDAADQTRSPTSNTIPSATTVSSSSSNGGDYFSIRRRPSTSQSQSSSTQTPGPDDDFSGWGGPGSSKGLTHETPSTPSTPGGGLMGKLKSFGKASRKAASESDTPSVVITAAPSEPSADEATMIQPRSLATRLKAQHHQLTPPSGHESPLITLPSDVTILISEELSSGWSPIYSRTLAHQSANVEELEKTMPDWLVEFLLLNKAPSTPVTKISFVLLPYAIPPELRVIYGHTLPELLNTNQTKLTAGRFLRVRKLTYHVQDKLDRGVQSKSNSPRSSTDMMHISGGAGTPGARSPFSAPPPINSSHSHSHHAHTYSISSQNSLQQQQGHHRERDLQFPRAEDVYEILCNDQLLPLEMTLAAVRQFVWRQSGELVMHYRRKPEPAIPSPNPSPTHHPLSLTRSHSPLVNSNLNPFVNAPNPSSGPHPDSGAIPHSAPAQTTYFNHMHGLSHSQSHSHMNPFIRAGQSPASTSSSSLNRVGIYDNGRGATTSRSRGNTPNPSPSMGSRTLPSTTPGGTPKAI